MIFVHLLLWSEIGDQGAQGKAKSDLLLNNTCKVFNGKIVGGRDKLMITLLEYIKEHCMKRIVNVQGVIDKCTGPLTPTTTRIIESIKKEAHLMKVCRSRKKRKRSKHKDEPFVKDGKVGRKGRTITCQSYGNTRHNKATCKGQGGNNAKASGSASRQAQQTEPAVGQDGSGKLGAGAIIGLSVAGGKGGVGGPGGAGVASQVSEIRNADGREMGDGVPTQSSAVGGASEIDNGSLFMVDEEDLTFKKLAPMAKEIIMLSEVSDIVWYTDEIREQLEKVADGWRDTFSYFVKMAVKKYADDE
ncbi:hypothetical protein Tco_0265984 [Tanacetum coccineum]